jgi:MoaD family protein
MTQIASTKTMRLFATLRDLTGQKEMTVPFQDGQTVRQLIEDIRDIHPRLAEEIVNEEGEMTGLVHILVHGRNTEWLQGLDTTIKETDQLVLMPPTAGG